MKIFISNDDGVHAPGIICMSNRLVRLGHAVTVVAPDRERSGAGHSITTTSLHFKQETFPGYDPRVQTFKCNGTPADCAMLGLETVAADAELVLAGINSGPNLGCDVFYSGTMAAAREGYFENRRSMAVSLVVDGRSDEKHYETAVHAVEALVDNLEVLFGSDRAALLNVNVPNVPLSKLKGFKVTCAGRRRYQGRVQTGATPGGTCYWVGGTAVDSEESEDSDVRAVNDGFVALTFLQHDTTDYGLNRRVEAEAVGKLNAHR